MYTIFFSSLFHTRTLRLNLNTRKLVIM